MNHYADAFAKIARYFDAGAIRQFKNYVLDGDETALNALRQANADVLPASNWFEQNLPLDRPWGDVDRRMVHALIALGDGCLLVRWVEQHANTDATAERFAIVVEAATKAGAEPHRWARAIGAHATTYAVNGQLTPIGRHVMGFDGEGWQQWGAGMGTAYHVAPALDFLRDFAPPLHRGDAVVAALDAALDDSDDDRTIYFIARYATSLDEPRWVSPFDARFDRIAEKFPRTRFLLGRFLLDAGIARRTAVTVEAAFDSFDGAYRAIADEQALAAVELLRRVEGEAGWPRVFAKLREVTWPPVPLIVRAMTLFGERSVADLVSALFAFRYHIPDANAVELAVALLDLFPAAAKAPLAATIEAVLRGEAPVRRDWALHAFIELIPRLESPTLTALAWDFLGDRRKLFRDAAARALATQGDSATPTAEQRLARRKKHERLGAVAVLATIGSPSAQRALETHLPNEPDADVRDAILAVLESAWIQRGRVLTRAELDLWVAQSADAMTAPIGAGWLDESALPALKFSDGTPFGPVRTRYLLFRQSRAAEIHPDVEARFVLPLLDRAAAADFALGLWAAYLAGPMQKKWPVALVGMLGDDRCVWPIVAQIREWAQAGRGKFGEYGVQALALIGTDMALSAVNGMALTFRAKNKNIGAAAVAAFDAAAVRAGVSPDELGDRVVPTFGFTGLSPRFVVAGGDTFEVRIGADLKLHFRNTRTGRAAKSLPRTANPADVAEFKEIAANLREIAPIQSARLERLMMQQQRWRASEWTARYFAHPILIAFAMRLVWGRFDATGQVQQTFRATPTGTAIDANSRAVAVPTDALVGIVHPLDLAPSVIAAWDRHLHAADVAPPFEQIQRAVYRVASDQMGATRVTAFSDARVAMPALRMRARHFGWQPGRMGDAGHVENYFVEFSAAQITAVIDLVGMHITAASSDVIRIRALEFFRQQNNGQRARAAMSLGEVPPIVFSETMRSLAVITASTRTH